MSIRNLFSADFPFNRASTSIDKVPTISNTTNVTINFSEIRALRVGNIVSGNLFCDATSAAAGSIIFEFEVPVLPQDNFQTNIECPGSGVWDNGGILPTAGTLQVVPGTKRVRVSLPNTTGNNGKVVVNFCYNLDN